MTFQKYDARTLDLDIYMYVFEIKALGFQILSNLLFSGGSFG
jgi:hypothetical protein